MMVTMVERVARALKGAYRYSITKRSDNDGWTVWDDNGVPLYQAPTLAMAEAFIEQQNARRAIEAMREPNVTMKLAGGKVILDQTNSMLAKAEIAGDAWRAMIDMTLRSKPEP